MKRKTVLDLWEVLTRLESSKHDVRFSYFIAKNKLALKPEVELLNNAKKPSEKFIEFEKKRVDLAQSCSKKDPNGRPVVQNNQYIIEDMEKFEIVIKDLREEYEKTIKERDKQIEDYESLLEEEVDFKLSKIRLDNMPNQIESTLMEIFLEADLISE